MLCTFLPVSLKVGSGPGILEMTRVSLSDCFLLAFRYLHEFNKANISLLIKYYPTGSIDRLSSFTIIFWLFMACSKSKLNYIFEQQRAKSLFIAKSVCWMTGSLKVKGKAIWISLAFSSPFLMKYSLRETLVTAMMISLMVAFNSLDLAFTLSNDSSFPNAIFFTPEGGLWF